MKKVCPHGKHHVPHRIILRGKEDSYYLECANCGDPGDDGLIAVWFTDLPRWGLDALSTAMLHESFFRLKYAFHRSLLTAHPKRKRREGTKWVRQ